jgi:hypothetical protein
MDGGCPAHRTYTARHTVEGKVVKLTQSPRRGAYYVAASTGPLRGILAFDGNMLTQDVSVKAPGGLTAWAVRSERSLVHQRYTSERCEHTNRRLSICKCCIDCGTAADGANLTDWGAVASRA